MLAEADHTLTFRRHRVKRAVNLPSVNVALFRGWQRRAQKRLAAVVRAGVVVRRLHVGPHKMVPKAGIEPAPVRVLSPLPLPVGLLGQESKAYPMTHPNASADGGTKI